MNHPLTPMEVAVTGGSGETPNSRGLQEHGGHQDGHSPPREPVTPAQRIDNAEIDARIRESLTRTHLGRELASEGLITVALDEDGHLVEYRPDGTTSMLD